MTHDLDTALRGISGILVTPYDDAGEIAPGRLSPIIDRALGAGVHMPVVNGNTGEFYALTFEEYQAVIRTSLEAAAGRVPVLVGIGHSTRIACELARSAGALFIRSYERGERVHLAMLSRGFDGALPVSAGGRASRAQLAQAACLPLAAVVTLAAVAAIGAMR